MLFEFFPSNWFQPLSVVKNLYMLVESINLAKTEISLSFIQKQSPLLYYFLVNYSIVPLSIFLVFAVSSLTMLGYISRKNNKRVQRKSDTLRGSKNESKRSSLILLLVVIASLEFVFFAGDQNLVEMNTRTKEPYQNFVQGLNVTLNRFSNTTGSMHADIYEYIMDKSNFADPIDFRPVLNDVLDWILVVREDKVKEHLNVSVKEEWKNLVLSFSSDTEIFSQIAVEKGLDPLEEIAVDWNPETFQMIKAVGYDPNQYYEQAVILQYKLNATNMATVTGNIQIMNARLTKHIMSYLLLWESRLNLFNKQITSIRDVQSNLLPPNYERMYAFLPLVLIRFTTYATIILMLMIQSNGRQKKAYNVKSGRNRFFWGLYSFTLLVTLCSVIIFNLKGLFASLLNVVLRDVGLLVSLFDSKTTDLNKVLLRIGNFLLDHDFFRSGFLRFHCQLLINFFEAKSSIFSNFKTPMEAFHNLFDLDSSSNLRNTMAFQKIDNLSRIWTAHNIGLDVLKEDAIKSLEKSFGILAQNLILLQVWMVILFIILIYMAHYIISEEGSCEKGSCDEGSCDEGSCEEDCEKDNFHPREYDSTDEETESTITSIV